ncbi:hypothetical protein OCK74_24500 [Chitinophagaceae bacterium LB-8]|uniref:Uncharacterized protein n=1 Tax=Paraflavisolibacter caeni TaxID=2982496 RepID=A0A9X2Y288_9BACT|nr:hypothetical protein [Paraflavisolibacter caeni]MCU7552303.1 hypothetical protein [Paraflavisolibacter caeni]
MENIAKPTTPILLSKAILLFVTAFTVYKAGKDAAFKDWFRVQKGSVASCGPNVSDRSLYREGDMSKFNNDHYSRKNDQPANKESGNGCPHQQGASTLCDLTGCKRRLLFYRFAM